MNFEPMKYLLWYKFIFRNLHHIQSFNYDIIGMRYTMIDFFQNNVYIS